MSASIYEGAEKFTAHFPKSGKIFEFKRERLADQPENFSYPTLYMYLFP